MDHRTTCRTDEFKQATISRLRSAAGHVAGIARMIEEDAYCIDVINQIQAVQAALSKISVMLLDDHLHSCVTEAVRGDDPDERERVLGEIRAVFEARGKL
ncbi:MAG: metal-sensitive transcriptional regulator [Anaerolineae bacterium]